MLDNIFLSLQLVKKRCRLNFDQTMGNIVGTYLELILEFTLDLFLSLKPNICEIKYGTIQNVNALHFSDKIHTCLQLNYLTG